VTSALRLRRRSDLPLALLDAAVALGACLLAYRLRFEGVHVPAPLAGRYRVAAYGVAVAWVLAARISGLYRRAALRRGVPLVPESVEAALGVGVALLLANAVALSGDLSRAWVGLVTFGLILGGVAARRAIRLARVALVPTGLFLERYAVVGDDLPARRLVGDLTRAPGAPFRVVGTLPLDTTPENVVARAREQRLDGLVVPEGALVQYDIGRLAAALSGAGVDVLVAPGMNGLEVRVARIVMLHGVPLLATAGLTPRRRAIRSRGHAERLRRNGVAILGTRGIPASYGGFETFAENLALRLTAQGVPVTVYCRSHYASAGREWRGVRLVTLPTVRNKYLDTVVHTGLSALHLLLRTRIRDVVLCNAANAPVLPLLRLGRRRVVMNVDGLEWRRGKWGVAGRSWYRMGEWLSVRLASVLVTDADEVRTYYRVRHDTESVMIPYGADPLVRGSVAVPPETPVAPDGYALYVSRWETENNPVLVAEAHAKSGLDAPLVMLGQATYDDGIDAAVRAAAAPHAVLPGPIFGDGYRGLQANARCYVHATEVGGTHPALIEALGAGNVCLVMDTPENREVVGGHGRYFADAESLADGLRWAFALPPGELAERRAAATAYAAARYSWDAVAAAYVEVLTSSR
jgi:glycosyltransferase involved in cell wall biosynthesis